MPRSVNSIKVTLPRLYHLLLLNRFGHTQFASTEHSRASAPIPGDGRLLCTTVAAARSINEDVLQAIQLISNALQDLSTNFSSKKDYF